MKVSTNNQNQIIVHTNSKLYIMVCQACKEPVGEGDQMCTITKKFVHRECEQSTRFCHPMANLIYYKTGRDTHDHKRIAEIKEVNKNG